MQNDGMNTPISSQQTAKQGEGCLGELTWLGMGLTLPVVNLNFYRKAAGRKFSSALIVFLVFAFFLIILTTLSLSNGLSSANQAIQQAYEQNEFPTITIQNGQATVDAAQPFYIVNEGNMLIALDTTGEITEIDPNRYTQGILLTRSDIQILQDDGRTQSITLAELQEVTGQDPLVLDQTSVQAFWQTFSKTIVVVGFFALIGWHMLVRFGYLALLALLIWPLVNQGARKVGYQAVLAVGAYVLIPAMILNHLFTRSGITFCGLQTLILAPLLGLVMWWVLRKPAGSEDEIILRPWEMLIPLPLFVLIVVDLLVTIPNGDIYLWGTAALTLVAAVAVARLYPTGNAGLPPTIEPLP